MADRPALETIAAVKAEIGEEALTAAVRMIDQWEDSTETASELVAALWPLLRRVPVNRVVGEP